MTIWMYKKLHSKHYIFKRQSLPLTKRISYAISFVLKTAIQMLIQVVHNNTLLASLERANFSPLNALTSSVYGILSSARNWHSPYVNISFANRMFMYIIIMYSICSDSAKIRISFIEFVNNLTHINATHNAM